MLVVTKLATPAAARRLGEARLARWLKAKGIRKADAIAGRVVAAAKAQRRDLPAAEAKAALAAEIASEILRAKERIAALDGRLEELTKSDPRGEIIRSLPGMGTTLTAEFLAEVGGLERFGSADGLAAAAGITPVLRSSGGVSYWRRAKKGNRLLKRVFYQSAHCAVVHHETSRGNLPGAGWSSSPTMRYHTRNSRNGTKPSFAGVVDDTSLLLPLTHSPTGTLFSM